MAESWFQKKHAKRGYELVYQQESAGLEATEAILHLMEKTGKSKADLAKALEKSKPYVTQALIGGRNMTLRTFAAFAWACGYSLKGFQLEPISAEQRPAAMDNAIELKWLNDPGEMFFSTNAQQGEVEEEDQALELVA